MCGTWQACLRMARDMISVVENTRTEEGGRIRMRIGLHTGSLIAGCIGTKTLRYDIWGADCLCSNAMESNGRPSCVLMSEATHTLVAEQMMAEKIVCRPHDVVSVNGFGDVNTFINPVTEEAVRELEDYERQRGENPVKVAGSGH